VEVESYSTMAQELAGSPVDVGGATIAEAIAVRDIGRKPLEIVRKFVKRVLIVPEQAMNAIALLAEEAKVVAEGAGAAGLAALLTYSELFQGRRVGVPICGANIDNRALANVIQRVMIRDGRLMRLVLDIPDRPGVLGEISTRIGQAGANIIEVSHHRLFTSPSVQSARLESAFSPMRGWRRASAAQTPAGMSPIRGSCFKVRGNGAARLIGRNRTENWMPLAGKGAVEAG
jgi:threonine dehydratase